MHDLVQSRLRNLVERLAPGGTRIFDPDVQLVLASGEFRGHRSDLIRIGDFGGYGVGFANLAKLRLGFLTGFGLSRRDIGLDPNLNETLEIGRASCRERVCQYV